MFGVRKIVVVRHQIRRALRRQSLIGAAQFIKQKFVG
jgi:hypothetical protein